MRKLTTVLCGISVLMPLFVQAQSEGVLEEITVTAQRREQNILEVPIAVTAFSGDELERVNIQGATDYLALTPNVSFTEDGQSGSRGLGLAIRGINNLVSGENAFVNSIGIYLDEFSIASVPNQVANPLLPDMERIEVLRGPQGTYFGRNSVGGALNITTRAPTDEFEGLVRLGAENYDDAGDMVSFTGVLNVPVNENFKARGVLFYEDSSGKVENIQPGATQDSGHDYLMLRLRGQLDFSDRTGLSLTLIHTDEEQGHDENVPSGVLDLDTVDTLGIQQAIDPGTGFWPRNRNLLSHDLQELNELQTTVFVANLTHDISDALTFKAIAGLIDAEQDRVFDNDGIGGVDALKRTNFYEGDSKSIELRLQSTGDTVDWVAGLLYANDEQKQDNNVAVSAGPTDTINGIGFLPPFPEGLGLALNNKLFEVDSLAIFADATFRVTDRLDLLAGARYTEDDVVNSVASFGIAPGPDAPNPGDDIVGFFQSFINVPRPTARGDRSFSDFSPRVGFRYLLQDEVNLYGTVSKGYKAGGASVGNNTNLDGSPAVVVPFEEEELWNYEIGIKAELFERRLRLNASAFYLEWNDLILEAFRLLTPGDLSSNFEQAINVREAEATGFEIDFVSLITDNFTLGGALGILDSEITSDDTAEITGGFVVNLKGLELPKAPETTFNLYGEYRWPLANGNDFWFRAEYIHRDGQYSDVEGLTNRQTRGPSPNQGLIRPLVGEFPYRSPDYDLVNLRAGYEADRWSLNVFVQNLTDEEYYTGTQENFGASGIRLTPHPRVIGANVDFRF